MIRQLYILLQYIQISNRGEKCYYISKIKKMSLYNKQTKKKNHVNVSLQIQYFNHLVL